jgi:nitroimidazol reductase NimA-like FMN-containing flavoprotein (pyridoxamine 5'-phosphate oxidase superfamily)
VIRGHHVGEPDKDGEILEVHGADGASPYVVRWSDDGHEGLFFPETDATVQRLVSDHADEDSGTPESYSDIVDLSLDDCLELLEAHHVGRIAVLKDDAPIILPVNYVLVRPSGLTWVAFRTRLGGIIESSELQVAFEVDEIDDATRTAWSVLVRGTLHHVDPDAADYRHRFKVEPWVEGRDTWMIIQPFFIEGRRLVRL